MLSALEDGDELVMHIKIASQGDTLCLGNVVTQYSDKVHISDFMTAVVPGQLLQLAIVGLTYRLSRWPGARGPVVSEWTHTYAMV